MATPYVNSVLVKSFINKHVCVVGEVLTFDSDRATIRTSDGGNIAVKLKSSPVHYSKIVEFTGTWTGAGFLEEHSHINYNDNFDLAVHDRLLRLMHGPYKKLFYTTEA